MTHNSKLPPTTELFSADDLVQRHPQILNQHRVQWALRHRKRNGLNDAVFETRSGALLVHEPEFIRWYLGLCGRKKPRALRKRLIRTIVDARD